MSNIHTLVPCPPLQSGHNAESSLRDLTARGVAERYGPSPSPEVARRAAMELNIIIGRRAASYMLVVAEYVNWAKQRGVLVGPGRGHVTGSLVAFALGITDIDPVQHGLLSERFISAEVATFPDMDVDFERGRRSDVVEHIVATYGAAHVAAIGSRESPNFVHTAGVLIANRPISAITHTEAFDRPSREMFLRSVRSFTEADYLECGRLGLTKFDLLGLDALDTIQRSFDALWRGHGIVLRPWTSDIPLDDKRTFELLQTANTDGVFQLSTRRTQARLLDLHADCFDDLVAFMALYRPNPIKSGVLTRYNERKRLPLWFIHPDLDEELRPILGETRGLLVYQEQMLMLAHVFTGMSLGEANRLRLTIRRNVPQRVEVAMAGFKARARASGYSEDAVDTLAELIVGSSDHAFQRAHAVAYALITYTAAFLKADFPDEYQAASASGQTRPK